MTGGGKIEPKTNSQKMTAGQLHTTNGGGVAVAGEGRQDKTAMKQINT